MNIHGPELYHWAEKRKIKQGLFYDLVERDPIKESCGKSKLGEMVLLILVLLISLTSSAVLCSLCAEFHLRLAL